MDMLYRHATSPAQVLGTLGALLADRAFSAPRPAVRAMPKEVASLLGRPTPRGIPVWNIWKVKVRQVKHPSVANIVSNHLGCCDQLNPRSGDNDVPFALILPGFLGSSEDFEDLARDMRRAGYQAAVAPIAWWHWVPCIGGRSMRPILDRIDHAVNQVLNSDWLVVLNLDMFKLVVLSIFFHPFGMI